MFGRRNEPDLNGNPGLQDNLRDALREQGGQILVYGDTGVGKSSLLRYAAEDEGMDLVSVDCLSSKSYEDLLEDAVRKLIDVREIKRQRTTRGSAEIEGGGGRQQDREPQGPPQGRARQAARVRDRREAAHGCCD
jgi:hypothetical protein